MTDCNTLIEKTCGHYGIIRERYGQPKVCCSQCEVLNQDDNATVSILRKSFVAPETVPSLPPREMDKWIRRQLDTSDTNPLEED